MRSSPAAKQLDDQMPQLPLPSSLTEAHSLTVAVDVHIIDHVLQLNLQSDCPRDSPLPNHGDRIIDNLVEETLLGTSTSFSNHGMWALYLANHYDWHNNHTSASTVFRNMGTCLRNPLPLPSSMTEVYSDLHVQPFPSTTATLKTSTRSSSVSVFNRFHPRRQPSTVSIHDGNLEDLNEILLCVRVQPFPSTTETLKTSTRSSSVSVFNRSHP